MHSDKPDKSSSNLLIHFGKRKFNLGFFALYLVASAILCLGTNFILDGGQVSSSRMWYVIFIGLAIGSGLYFWDLRKARKAE